MRLDRFAICVALMLVSACTSQGTPRAPKTELEKSIFFVERDSDGGVHGISTKTDALKDEAQTANTTEPAPPLPVKRIPWGHDVDVNSQIELQVRTEELKPHESSAAFASDDTAITARADAIKSLYSEVERYLQVRADTVRAFSEMEALPDELKLSSPAGVRFRRARDDFDEQMRRIAGGIRELWAGGDPEKVQEAERVHELANKWLREKDPREFLLFLEREGDRVRADAAAVVERAKSQAVRLRIEAFLVSGKGGKEPVAMHVPGYDRIAEKSTQSIDRWGLSLTETERKALEDARTAVREIAEAAEKVRRGEATFAEAFAEVKTAQAAKLKTLLVELESLERELRRDRIEQRLTQTKAALQRFSDELQRVIPNRIDAELRVLSQEASAAVDKVASRLESVQALLRLIETLRQAEKSWRAGNLANPQAAFDFASTLTSDATTLTENLPDLVKAIDGLGQEIEPRIQSWTDAAAVSLRNDVLAVYRSETVGLEPDLQAWQALGERVRVAVEALIAPAKVLAGLQKYQPLPLSIRAPDLIDPLLDNAPDTTLDLMRTERMAGDQLEVRTSLIEGDGEKVIDSAAVRLDVRKLGWHADPVPGIVLVQADRLAGADNSGGFSASLSWMLRYGPRQDEDGKLAESARLLGWGVGVHAALLNFDPDNDAEIGLGVTLGLWGDLLLFGAGYNPLADSANDGQVYYFIGSSLIPLLQAME